MRGGIAKQVLRPADAVKRLHDVQREGQEAVVVRVCQIAFRLGPDEFVGVEFEARSRGSDGSSRHPTAHDRAAQVTEQVREKRDEPP
jgi:hypothetical protein